MTEIKNVLLYMLEFPTTHFISAWRAIRKTGHILAFVITEDSMGFGEGTPYGATLISDYSYALKLVRSVMDLKLEEGLKVLRELQFELFENKKKLHEMHFGSFLALESALLDALAKVRRVSVAEVLGGVYRTVIPVAGTVFLDHPLKMVERVRWWLERGVKHLKLKIPCNINALELYLNVITSRTRLKEEDVTLRVDANECFKELNKAYKALQIMGKYGVDIVEQPMPRDRLREMAKLRKTFSPKIKIMLDESLTKPQDLETFATMEVADIVNFHPSKLGCLSITRDAILYANKLGLQAQIGSSLMTEVGLIHYLNLSASIPRLDYPLEEVGIHQFYNEYSILRKDQTITSLYTIENGSLKLLPVILPVLDFQKIRKFVKTRREYLLDIALHIFREGFRRLPERTVINTIFARRK